MMWGRTGDYVDDNGTELRSRATVSGSPPDASRGGGVIPRRRAGSNPAEAKSLVGQSGSPPHGFRCHLHNCRRTDLTAAEDAAVLRQFRRGADTMTIARWYGVDEASIAAMLDRARAAERRAKRAWDDAGGDHASALTR